MVQVVLFNTAVGKKTKDVKIAVVNKESSCVHPNYSACFLDENSTVTLSCSYLEYLIKQSYDLVSICGTNVTYFTVGSMKVNLYIDDLAKITDFSHFRLKLWFLMFHRCYTND